MAVLTLLQPNTSGKTTPPTPRVSARPNGAYPLCWTFCSAEAEVALQFSCSVRLSRDLISHLQHGGGRWDSNYRTGCCLWAEGVVDLPSSAQRMQALPISLPGSCRCSSSYLSLTLTWDQRGRMGWEAGLTRTDCSPPLLVSAGPSKDLSFCPNPAAIKRCESALHCPTSRN